jgi:mRNA interferase RelE/StbE
VTYRVEFAPLARRQIKKLPREVQKRIIERVEELSASPRPAGVIKLVSEENLYRVRVGEYRVVYQIRDRELISRFAYLCGNFLRLPRHRVFPNPESFVRVDCIHPALGRLRFDVRQIIESFCLKDKMLRGIAFQADDEVRNVIMRLPVVEVRNREAEPGVFHEGQHSLMLVDG